MCAWACRRRRVSGAAGGGLLCCDALGDGVDLVGGEAFEEFEVLVVGEAVFAGGAFDGECLLGGFGAFGCGLGDLVALLVIGELGEAGFLGCLLLRLLDSGEFLLDCLAGFAFGDERLLRAGVGSSVVDVASVVSVAVSGVTSGAVSSVAVSGVFSSDMFLLGVAQHHAALSRPGITP
ncbi:hypothetical protein GS489_08165 [Rhodococcus hoagii]|nr:hypothetical protein [Prescottella equi]